MRNVIKYSVYQLKGYESIPFSPDEFSKFKFGAKNLARKFGFELAAGFIKNVLVTNLPKKQIVVLPSAYSHIETASFFLTYFFIQKLNDFLVENLLNPVEEAKIYRSVTYRVDYGEMTAEQRLNLIQGDKFYIDKEFLKDKILVLIDDIKITGTHERIISKMLDDYKIESDCYFLYFAELTDQNISPKIENFLNLHYVKSLQEIDSIIHKEEFVFNTRVIKFLLQSNHEDFKIFIKSKTTGFISDLFYKAIGNSYNQFIEYQTNLDYLKTLIFNTKADLVN
jgi:hypothetical protein